MIIKQCICVQPYSYFDVGKVYDIVYDEQKKQYSYKLYRNSNHISVGAYMSCFRCREDIIKKLLDEK